MTSTDFARQFAAEAPWSRSDADQRALRLRQAGLLSKTPRGQQPVHISPEGGANFFLAVTATGNARRCADVVPSYAALLPDTAPPSDIPLGRDHTFHAYLTALLGCPELTEHVDIIRVHHGRQQARIYWRVPDEPSPRGQRFFRPEDRDSPPFAVPYVSVTAEIRGHLLYHLACYITGTDPREHLTPAPERQRGPRGDPVF